MKAPQFGNVRGFVLRQKEGQQDRKRRGVNNVLAELLVGIGDVARLAGLTQIVAVFDARMFRILEAAGV